jgi:CheY-like chemotaxis protein
MVLRYVDGLDPQSVADELNISRRHFYREQQPAFEAIASILWTRYVIDPAQIPKEGTDGEQGDLSTGRLELLREEVARMDRAQDSASLHTIVPGVHSILAHTMKERRLDITAQIPDDLPRIAVDPGLLRQMIMAVLGCLVEHSEEAEIRLRAQIQGPAVELAIGLEPSFRLSLPAPMLNERLADLGEMAALSQCSIEAVQITGQWAGFRLSLPVKAQQTILVVDDNDDALELFRRYLGAHAYRVATARSAQEALAAAHRLQPHAIILDLMMPGQDGWDVLQTLLHQPETHHLPVIICSVLRQGELAHMLGATAFLEKPVSEQALLEILATLDRG